MNDILATPIEYLKGIGPQRGEVLRKEARIFTFGDLLHYFPFRYIDKTRFQKIEEIPSLNTAVQLKVKIVSLREQKIKRTTRLEAKVKDDTGMLTLNWFNAVRWIKPKLEIGREIIIYGKPNYFKGNFVITHPEIDFDLNQKGGLEAVYPSGEKLQRAGFNSRGFKKAVNQLLPSLKGKIVESLPSSIIGEAGLISKEEAFFKIHNPQNLDQAKKANARIKFEELFYLQMELLTRKKIAEQKISGLKMTQVGDVFMEFYKNHLPFELTGAQKRVVKEIRADLASGIHMNRLLQGDVGSGKTLVALLVALIANGNGFQACIMAPTEILAQQHYNSLSEFLKDLDVRVELLTGSVKQKDRKPIHEGLEDGSINILVGTHALLESKVKYKNLGLAIIDEQHRFGVAQRSKLWKKNALPPHILVMTATPIPRTLAMTFYGDLDVSVIDEMPPGRKDIVTSHRFDSSRLRVLEFIKEQLDLGRQAYVVYPLIEESEKLDYKNLMDGYEAMTRKFPLPNYRVSIVHGRMKPEDKDFEMQQFAKGNTHIMVATTVIEVGVNVPNASVMIIESAEKFGLSQLHQLRGRVGRGANQSYCILMTGEKLSADAKTRLQTMVATNDGFKISEADLKLRGPGNLLGTQQSGILDLKLADLSKDSQLVSLSRDIAQNLLEKDPKLEAKEHQELKRKLKNILSSKPNWSRIS
ncbi:MAG: ATP-dependent DNA helicase RecG [Crocinitomicaceae bacterium]|nr:ATP-dependent DNA helicase RecG [Crocinitomicaceae bacterium]